MKLNRIGILPGVLCLFLLPSAARAADPFAELVRPTEPLTPAQEQQTFHLPPGFEIQLVAAEPDLRKPMNMAFDVTGRLWITESREYPFAATNAAAARDTIRIFSDFDTNGRARTVSTFATNLNIPIGLHPFRGPASANPQSSQLTWKCIAWSIPNIWLFEDTDGDGKADKQEILYGPFDCTRDTHGNQASFRRGSDGWLYATHGFNNDSHVRGRDGHEVHLNSGNIYRLRLDGSRIEHWTHGQVNPFGLCFDPLGNLYSADCHSSPIYQLLRGAYYPSFGKPDDGLGFAPVTIRHSHGSTAICGIVYISDPAWPAEFQDNILVGNVMTSRLNRDRIEWHGSTSVGHEAPDFLTTDDPWFRPVDLQWGPDGTLYMTDFYNRIIGHYEVPLTHPGRDRERGRIWRIVYRGADGKKPAARSLALPQDINGLIAELGSPNQTRRMLAMNDIADRFGKSATPDIQSALVDPTNSFQQVHALWLLHRLNPPSPETGPTPQALLAASRSKDAFVRVHAQRIAADMLDQFNGLAKHTDYVQAGFEVAMNGLRDSDRLVQRCAAEALDFVLSQANVRRLLELLARVPSDDTHLRYVVRKSIRNQLNNTNIFQSVAPQRWSKQELQVLTEVSLAVPSEKVAIFLLNQDPAGFADNELRRRSFEHIARYAPVGALDQLAQTVTTHDTLDTDFQLALFQTVQQGFARRGAALTPKLRHWGTGLAHNLLAETGDTATWGNTPLAGAKDTTNPWTFQERKCADGRPAQLMSSHPLGEKLTGWLRSAPFELPPTLSFYLCGHDGFPNSPLQNNSFVRLRDAQTDAVLREVRPPRHDTARLVAWTFTAEERAAAQRSAGILPAEPTSPSPLPRTASNTAAARSRRVIIEAVDGNSERAYAWLAFGRFDPELPELALIAPNQTARWQQAGAELAQSLNLIDLLPRLITVLRNTATDFNARATVASAVASLQGDGLLITLAGALKDLSLPEPARRPLAAAIAGDISPARAAVETAMQRSPTLAQQKLAQLLATNPKGAELLLSLAETGKVTPRVLVERAIKDRLAAVKPTNWEVRLARLTANLPPDDAARQKLVDDRKTAFNATKANAANGVATFKQVCAVCHQIGGQGALVGPQLDGIGNRGLERLLEDILDPNRNVDHAFRSQLVVLKDGDVVSGLPRREEGAVLVMVDSTGKEVQVTKTSIATRRESESSLMPDNFGEAMTTEQLQDLLGFLLSQAVASAASK